jgi:head-tail adaptor
MRNLVEIQRRVSLRTPTGDETEQFVPIEKTPRVWASILLIKPREGVAAGASMIEAADFKITIYWRNDLDGSMRLVDLENNILYDLVGPPTDDNGARRSLTCYAVKRSLGPHA